MKKHIVLFIVASVLVLSFFIGACAEPEESIKDDEAEETEEIAEDEEIKATNKPKITNTSTPEETPAPTYTPKPIYTLAPTATIVPTATPAPPEELEGQLDFSNSSPLWQGTYVLGYVMGSDEYNENDINFQIHDDTTGTFYVSDAQHNRFEANDFTYTFIDNKLTFLLDTGQKLNFIFTPTDNDEIVLVDENTEARYHFYTPYFYMFTSYGSWVAVKEDGTLGYVCYWQNGIGYAKNWGHIEQMVTFNWYYDYGTLQYSLHNIKDYFEEAYVDHYGNITELTYPLLDDYTQVLYRADGDIMYGYYRLEDTDGVGDMIKELNLYENWDASCVINEDGEDIAYDNIRWYVNITEGKLIIGSYGDMMEYEYFYGGDRLILYDNTTGYTYIMTKGIDPMAD